MLGGREAEDGRVGECERMNVADPQITFIKEMPAYAGFYGGYEVVKRFWARQFGGNDKVPVWALLSAGASGGVTYWLASYPLDIAKSRIQLADKPPMKGHWLKGGYVVNELKTIVREGGV